MNASRLVGTWRLASLEVRDAEGKTSYPYGEGATGYIIYTDDGYVIVTITADDRRCFAADDILTGTLEERAEAAATCLAYAGRYAVDGDWVVHTVEVSLFPNWVGHEQRRLMEFSGTRLTLSTKPMTLAGVEQQAYMIWELIEDTQYPRSENPS